ncbi:hypothetical protein F4818DRAFT_440949 [Hypoxylon cercidicola]|nr:hypothetical protein F4818DRAFT_440949 [Hypoxylon cercidicola]
MDNMLRCNTLKCRKELRDQALVTTCSHIFCTDCAARLGLTGQRHEHRNSCPACGSQLTNPDDAVISNLNPSEDYKTSVLSGLSPNVIIECASRALSFWAYQANSRIDQDSLRRQNEELTQAYKEKNRKNMQIQELYDKLKRKAMLGQMQNAAEDAADSTLHGPLEDGQQFEGGIQNPQYRPALYEQYRTSDGYQNQTSMQNPGATWPRVMGAQSNVPNTPSTHRQRLGDPTSIGLSTIPGLVAGTPRTHQTRMNARAPLGEMSNNLQNNARFPAVGLSSGLKVSHGAGNPDGFSASATRPRAAQRPTPVSSTFNRRPTGGQPENILGGIRSGYTNL